MIEIVIILVFTALRRRSCGGAPDSRYVGGVDHA